MKYLLSALISLSFLFGCSPSIIKIKPEAADEIYSMFGKTPERNFYTPQSIGDTLIKKWENDVNGGFSYTSVTVYGSYVFASDLSGRIFCFNNNNGKSVGKLRYKGAVFSAPVIEKKNIIFAVASENDNITNLISYNFILGKETYNIEIKGKVLTEIIKADSSIIFNTNNGKIFRYAFYGEKRWEFDSKSFVHSSPAVDEGIVFLGNDRGEIIAVNFNNGKLIYRKKIGEPFYAGATIRSGIAFIGNDNGKLYAVNLKSGNIKWEFDSHARITMVPAVKGDTMIVGNLAGDLYALKKSDGTPIWKIKTGGLLNATPLIAGNSIILPDFDKKFYLINLRTGKIFKTYYLDGRAKLSPVIADSTLFIGYENGNICAYKF